MDTIGKSRTCGKEIHKTKTSKSGKRTNIKRTKLGNKKERKKNQTITKNMQKLLTKDSIKVMVNAESKMVH